jgi:hypothetical protein
MKKKGSQGQIKTNFQVKFSIPKIKDDHFRDVGDA